MKTISKLIGVGVRRLVVSLQFWAIWTWEKCHGLQNWKWREVRMMPHELKAEVVRMWKAPTMPDDDFS